MIDFFKNLGKGLFSAPEEYIKPAPPVLYAKAGEFILTEKSGFLVYVVTRDIMIGDPIVSGDFKSVCDLPDPKTGDPIKDKYHGEYFAKTFNWGRTTFHFKDGWR